MVRVIKAQQAADSITVRPPSFLADPRLLNLLILNLEYRLRRYMHAVRTQIVLFQEGTCYLYPRTYLANSGNPQSDADERTLLAWKPL